MLIKAFRIFIFTVLISTGCLLCNGQSGNNKDSIFSKPEADEDDRPKGLKESLEKMRIEKEKKEHNEMIERGEEALMISEQLEKAFADNGRLSEKEIAKLAAVEKIVKKIRSELGGEDDEENSEQARSKNRSLLPAEAIKSLRSTTITLFDELKKTTRFSISAAAIQTSNAVINLARFLRLSN